MFDGWTIAVVALVYVGVLFVVAWIGDRIRSPARAAGGRPLTYALSLAIYCTSWTFFGSVGLAATTGYDFLPVYIGPILLFLIGWPLVLRVVRLAKSQNITSVADFLAARYGKSQAVAAIVTLVAVVGSLPYIALQLKAIAVSIETMLGGTALAPIELPNIGYNTETSFVITLLLAAFAILFGTRHIDATEHQDGLILAVATESLIKLTAFLAVGSFVAFSLYAGPGELIEKAAALPEIASAFGRSLNGGSWLTVVLLSSACALLLPRQFHVTVVENRAEREVRRAAWMFPLYLVAINLFVVPIAAAGLLSAPRGMLDPDFYVLSLPIGAGSELFTLVAFLGGLSAATAMVIVESIALAIMISNGLVIPVLLRNSEPAFEKQEDMAWQLLAIRRVAIVTILVLGYLVYRALGKSQGLAAIGLISFSAIAQLAPAFLAGLMWRKGTARGAIAGILAGFAVWAYTLLLPWIVKAGWISGSIVTEGPFGLGFLKPQALLYLHFDPLTHGVLWSLGANAVAFVVVSLLRAPEPVERVQAHIFVQEDMPRPAQTPAFRLWRSSISVSDLQHTVSRYLGPERAERSFAEYLESRASSSGTLEADIGHIRFAEHLLTSAIGAASARLVLSLLLRRRNVSGPSALKLLDDASEALQYNRDLLQSALDQVRHGLAVFDKDMRLICWNRQFRELLSLPSEYGRVGVPVDRILRFCAERGDLGGGTVDELVAERLMKLAVTKETFQERMSNDRILEVRTAAMPQGGVVATYLDITDRVEAASALARANETLERRVRERTAELLQVNAALAIAKSKADEANLDKTRFIAAASHDILQPLNAARLYASSLAERPLGETDGRLARNVDASLAAVEEIFSALIDISRLDAGRMEPEITDLPLASILEQLKLEFTPVAREKGLELRVAPTGVWVRSDRRLIRRLLQNLVSNAIKYTPSGRVLLGARRHGGDVRVLVLDTGPGIPEDKQAVIFKEFERLDATAGAVRGLGLGLSIVERIGRVLGHPIELVSTVGRGSAFSMRAPRVAPQAKPQAEVAPLPAAGSLSGHVVLCIDNEPAVIEGMATLLRGWGCHVLTASSAMQAAAVVRASGPRPEAILADYHLDEGTGIEAIDAVRAIAGAQTPAVVITADHSAEVQRDVRLRGIGMLRKPVRAAALRAVLAQHLIARRPAAAE